MAWNVRLAEWLLSQSGEAVLLWFVAVMSMILIAMIGCMWVLSAHAISTACREWTEQTGTQLLMRLHQHQVKKIIFNFDRRIRIGNVSIEGPHISFSWSPQTGIVSGQDHSIAWLFVGHADTASVHALMQYMHELAPVNEAWLDYRERPGSLELLRSAEIIPLRKAG